MLKFISFKIDTEDQKIRNPVLMLQKMNKFPNYLAYLTFLSEEMIFQLKIICLRTWMALIKI